MILATILFLLFTLAFYCTAIEVDVVKPGLKRRFVYLKDPLSLRGQWQVTKLTDEEL